MQKILILPGDGQGSEAVAAIANIIGNATDQVEVLTNEIGFPAYEKHGEYLPYDVLDQVSQCPIAICGPTADFGEGETKRNPLQMLMDNLDIFGRSRRFRTVGCPKDAPQTDITTWGSNIKHNVDITETPDVDGITVSKYIRSAFYTRMMNAALTDLEKNGRKHAMCLARGDIFPESSRLFYDSFRNMFDIDGIEASCMNICDWLMDDRSRLGCEYVIVADLYLQIAESIAANMTGGDSLSPVKYSCISNSLIVPREREGTVDPVSCIAAAATALADLGLKDESKHILEVLDRTVAAGDRPPSMGGMADSKEFIELVASRI